MANGGDCSIVKRSTIKTNNVHFFNLRECQSIRFAPNDNYLL